VPFAQGVAPQAITGIDVSPRMLAHAKRLYPGSFFFEADFLGPAEAMLQAPEGSAAAWAPAGASKVSEEHLLFDAVVLNACFANVGPNPRAVLLRAAQLCRPRARKARTPAEPHSVNLGAALGATLDDSLLVLAVDPDSQLPPEAVGQRIAALGGVAVATSSEFKATLAKLRASGKGSAAEVTYAVQGGAGSSGSSSSSSSSSGGVEGDAASSGGGVVVVSHPFGSAFCHGLASDDGLVAKTSLPNRKCLEHLIAGLPLALEHFEDGTPYVWQAGAQAKRGMYLAVLRVTPGIAQS
jgi:hypothetical protein